MVSAALLLLAQVPAATAATPPRVARVPGSFLHVAVEIPGLTLDDRNATILRKVFGDRGVLIGAVPSKRLSVELLATKVAGEPKDDAAWRKENLEGSGSSWTEFDAAGFACAETTTRIEGSGSREFHAFFVRGGYAFDLHFGESLGGEQKSGLSREAFVEVLGSVRFAVVRRGTWEQMPARTLDAMHEAIARRKDAIDLAKASGDAALHFAAAELARHFGAPPAEQIEAYRWAIRILAAKEQLSAAETLAHAASEDGLALALLDSNDPAAAIPHLDRALAIAHDLTAPVRAGIAYNLACAHARLGHEEIAVARLLDSEGWLPGAIDRARADPDFDPIRESKRFQDAVKEVPRGG